MKKLLLLLVLFGCKKEEKSNPVLPPVPSLHIIGTYDVGCLCDVNSTGKDLFVIANTSASVKMYSATMEACQDTFIVNVDKSKLTIPFQQFKGYSISGSGTYSEEERQINMTITKTNSTKITCGIFAHIK